MVFYLSFFSLYQTYFWGKNKEHQDYSNSVKEVTVTKTKTKTKMNGIS